MTIKESALLLLILLVMTGACKPGPSNPDSEVSGVFVPNPQHVGKQEVKTLEPDARAPDFTLPDINGKMFSLRDFAKARIFVVVFTCNHCPTAQAYEERLIRFTSDYRDKDVAVVAIMPNSAKGLLLEECGYTDLNDSWEEMKIRAADRKFNFPYLYDGDNHAVSVKYGPVATPHVFVFDRDRKLRYTGNLDQSEKPGTGNAENLRAATDALLAGQTVANPVTKSFGCSIKWAWKLDWAETVNKQWDEKTAGLADIDINGIRDLVRNNSKKLRLVNVWATWCAPCVAEFPELVKLQRMYGARDFEFVSLSADKQEIREKVQDFLQKSHAAIQNYMYSGTDKYQLIEAVDPKWNGALPYTLLIEPGGKIIWTCQGAVNLIDLKKTIVDHPMIGRYY